MADSTVVFPAPGQKDRRLLAFGSRTLAGYEWPYFAISGATDGPTLGLTAGIHGAEYPPIGTVMQFCRTLDPAVPFVLYVGTPNRQVEETAQAMALASGIPRVIRSVTTGSTYAAATAAGIPAILAEVGGQGVWSEELVQQHEEGTPRVLRYLSVLSGEQPAVDRGRPIYATFAWMRAEAAGLFHSWVQVGDSVERGQAIGRITDYFGNERQRLDSVAGGEVGFLVTSLAINAGDPLLAIIS